MRIGLKCLLPALGVLAAISMFAQSQSEAQQPTPKTGVQADKAQAKPSHDAQPEEQGERIFEQNCSRCHTAPDGFSSRISGTVIRHMRVRASLSQHDAQELLRFLNP
jgi:cytochrome c2